MNQRAPKRSTPRNLSGATVLVGGLIFVLFSSCMPSTDDQAFTESPTRRRSTTSGDPAAASNENPFGSTFNNSGNDNSNSMNNPSSGFNSGSNAGNTNTNSGSSGNNNMINSNSGCYKADDFVCKVERLIGEKTNKYRQGRGLQPLALDAKIAFVSRDWSQKMSRSGRISHAGFPSSRVSVYRTEFNTSRSLRGENVAMTGRVSSSLQDDAAAEKVAQEFAVMWWNSSGHRANMLGRFKSLGVGVHKTSRGSWYATQIFE